MFFIDQPVWFQNISTNASLSGVPEADAKKIDDEQKTLEVKVDGNTVTVIDRGTHVYELGKEVTETGGPKNESLKVY